MRPIPTALTAASLCLATTATPAAEPFHDLTLDDAGRAIPVRLWVPPHHGIPVPVVIFSHGLGGSREGYAYLAKAWSASGYVVILPTHVGSDTTTIRDARKPWPKAMAEATRNPDNLHHRPRDIQVVIDHLADLPRLAGVPDLTCDASRIGVAGHSFGAWTTLAVAGFRSPLLGHLSDARPTAFIALSPTGPNPTTPADAGADVTRPILVMTGTQDSQPSFLAHGNDQDYHWRIRTFDMLASGHKYLAVLDGARHCAFADDAGATLQGDPPSPPWMTAAVVAATTTFWDATLRDDATARQRLESGHADGAQPGQVTWRTR
jgi:predicted dienelactone hydrolase